ncbi:hypothetical protein [Cupriavidus plantarum]|uniref:hypothetical protein n=1 Tax=Cupriavidus plantarum TaxID=942865 RepID=UPI00339D61FC
MSHGLHAGVRGRASWFLSLVVATSLLSACGGDDAQAPAATQAPTSRLVVDTGTAAPAQGGTLTLKATLLDKNGQEVQGAKFAWASSNDAVAAVVSAADISPAAASVTRPVGIYATVRLLAAGEADIVATATLSDGTQASSTTHLSVQPAAAKTYALTLSPSTLTLNTGAAAQAVTAVVRRSDGVDGVADLKDWSWSTDNSAFAVTPASDSRSAKVSTTGTLAAVGQLTACSSTPAGDRLCANTALTRPAVPLPAIGFSVSSLSINPGHTGTVTATFTDAQGANLAGQGTLAWSIQQSGSAASIVSIGSGGSVTIGMDAAQAAAYTATLTVTATYPDGRFNSSSLPLSSPGLWTRLPDAPIANPSIVRVAIDGTRVWRLTADGTHPARLERFGANGSTPTEPTASLPATANGIWLAAATNPANSSLMVQLGQDDVSTPFGYMDADLAGLRTDVALHGCVPAGGRSFVKTTDGIGIASMGWCANSWQYWLQRVGSAATPSFPVATVAPILDARPFASGDRGMALHNDGVNEVLRDDGGMLAYTYTSPATLSLGAVAADVADESGRVYGYAASLGIVSRPFPGASYASLWNLPPAFVQLRAVPNVIVGLSASSFSLRKLDTNATVTVGLPMGSTPTDFVSAVDADGKVRIAATFVDGSVWLYQEP